MLQGWEPIPRLKRVAGRRTIGKGIAGLGADEWVGDTDPAVLQV
jgi:hypothetical protein